MYGMNKINVKDTYVEGFAKGVRLVVNPFDIKNGELTVIIQGKQTKVFHDGEEFVNLGLSWLSESEAVERFGSIVTEMVKAAKKITLDVCGTCGKVQEHNTMFHQDGTDKCERCATASLAWYENWYNATAKNMTLRGETPLARSELRWSGGLTMTPLTA